MSSVGFAPWIAVLRRDPTARRRLLCFPHAGGPSAGFREWPKFLLGTEVCVVTLPGRAGRFRDPFVESWEELLSALAAAWSHHSDRPFALFGHSFGALLAFEFARWLRREGASLPSRLYVSAMRAPQLGRRFGPLHQLPDREFLEAVSRRHRGVPEILLRDSDLFALSVPPLKSDFRLFERYQFREAAPLPCPINAFVGQDDPAVRPDEMTAWAAHTRSEFTLEHIPGDHFFYIHDPVPLLRSVGRTIGEVTA